MRVFFIAVIALFLSYSFSALGQNWELVWSDEFNGNSLDTTIWNYEIGNGEGGWGTGQIDYCTDKKKNVMVNSGKLHLTCRKEEISDYHYTAGRINTKDKYFTKYGKIEARIKIPGGRGIGAALWMLPQYNKYGWWPRSGEIDILEINGHEHHVNYGTVHYMQWETHQYKGTEIKTEKDLTEEFSDYTITWDEKAIKWYLDGKLFNEMFLQDPIDGRRPFNEEFYIILSTGIGSNFSGKIIEDSILPQSMEVEYIRVYKEVYAPQVVMAKSTLDGKKIEVSFSEELKEVDKSYTDFELKDDQKVLVVSGLSMRSRDDRTIGFQLAEPINKSSTVDISYTGNNLKSKHNQLTEKFYNLPVINNTIGASPVVIKVRTNNSYSIEITFNKELTTELIEPTNFVVLINKSSVNIKSAVISPFDHRAINLTIDNPMFSTDSIKVSYTGSLIQSVDNGILKPFNFLVKNVLLKKSIVPGKIEAEDFVKQEGVVVENTTDENGGKNVGYIENNDWMEYEIFVSKTGSYEINYRVSSESSGGTIAFQIDGILKDRVQFRPTHNWQFWSTTTSYQKIELQKGVHKIKVIAEKGGFNLNWISMTTN